MTRRQLLFALTPAAVNAADGGLWLETSSFDNPGGWVVDHQSIDRIGSAFLLAHGCGRPVADAETVVHLSRAGDYFVFVRTRDWVGPWKTGATAPELKASGSPGAFKLLVSGRPLHVTFGTEGADWHWQPGGQVRLPAGAVCIALRDLSGFDGRCAAVYFSPKPRPALPESATEVRAWRSRLHGSGETHSRRFDFVVVGGGAAGICAAVAAARCGIKVALLQNRPVLGGNSSSEIRVSPNSVRSVEPYPGLGSVFAEFDWNRIVEPVEARRYQDGDRVRSELVGSEPGISLFMNQHVFQVDKEGPFICAVLAQDIRSGAVARFEAPLFADCTGDAAVGYLAGAEWRMGRESRARTSESRAPEGDDSQVLGSTLHWYTRFARDLDSAMPDLPWALQFDEERCQHATEGGWSWETGFHLDQASEAELVRDYMLRAIYGNWAYQKNASGKKEWYRSLELAWVGYVLGKRESRRLVGDVVLTQLDLDSGKPFPDGMIACDWGIDIHLPEPKNNRYFAGWAFRSVAEHYDKGKAHMRWMPYRCLYSRNIANLFMAGRNASSTHVAFAWFRNQRTTAMMGELVGLAAAIGCKRRSTPRGVYEKHLNELKAQAKAGAGKRVPA